MNFLKASVLSGLSTVIKLASGLVINKVIAVYIGPAGIAMIGQFQNFLRIITTIGTGAINTGVTKYVAEYNETDENKRNDVISAALIITILLSVILGAVVFLGSSYISVWTLKTEDYSSVFKLLGITLIFISFNTVLLSIINGLKKIKLFITVNICSSLLSLLITSLLTSKYGVFGALLAMVIVQSIILLITLPAALKKMHFKFVFNKSVSKSHYEKLFAFSLMAIVAVLSELLTQIMIRNYLIKHFSMEAAGYWQSVWTISTMYLMVVTTAFSTYYLPRLSELQTPEEIREEILSGYKIILPFVFITALSIYLLRDVIILILFTPEFTEMRSLFLFQLIGDFFKMASWSLGFLMIAKAMTRIYILTEIVFSLSFYGLTMVLTGLTNNVEAVTLAYALNDFMYFIVVLILFRHIIFIKNQKVGLR